MQTPPVALNIGADVGKDEIVVACAEESFAPRKIRNQRAALLAFLKDLPAGSRIGLESTGIYHELLAELAHQRGFVVYPATMPRRWGFAARPIAWMPSSSPA
jgi:transposase